MEKICKYCKEKFIDVNGKWFSNHVRWCNKNPSRNDTENLTKSINDRFNKKLGLLKQFKVNCFKCDKEFKIEEREKLFPQKDKYFCSKSCSNCRPQSEETKKKIRQSVTAINDSKGVQRSLRKIICQNCNKEFETKKKTQIFCSVKCGAASRKASTEYLQYKSDCRFQFNVWDFPEEFDLGLIYKHGWYKAKNHGDNLNGVSRDHKISVKFGWENGIDPSLISHPANCQLMVHTDNIGKNKKCSILLNELKESIDKWNRKY